MRRCQLAWGVHARTAPKPTPAHQNAPMCYLARFTLPRYIQRIWGKPGRLDSRMSLGQELVVEIVIDKVLPLGVCVNNVQTLKLELLSLSLRQALEAFGAHGATHCLEQLEADAAACRPREAGSPPPLVPAAQGGALWAVGQQVCQAGAPPCHKSCPVAA